GWPEGEIIRYAGDCDFYLRRTEDGRILAGGMDSTFGRLAGMLPVQKLAGRRWDQMLRTVQKMFPGIRSLTPAYQWSGRELRTPDSLPVIGTHSEYPDWIFALCPGSSGILWAELAGRMAVQLKKRTPPSDAAFLSPERFREPSRCCTSCSDC
ncbi:MAG: FAD-binding oxidoreductase, partial [Clostridiales bacterium]|nr:FAD-binding oxidoreductase [Clostridiales bacterium]